MAALNTIRTKGGVLVAIIISASLLAFLLGDLTNSSSSIFSSNQTVGSVLGEDISVQEYSNVMNEYTLAKQMLTGTDSQTEEESTIIRSQSWDRIIREKLFGPSLENLGLMVSDDEAIDMVSGEYIAPLMLSIFSNYQTGGYDYTNVSNFIQNIENDPSGRSAQLWKYIETENDEERILSKYFSLVEQGVYTTAAEVAFVVDRSNKNYSFEFITEAAYSVADSLVGDVTNSEIKAYYESNKEKYKTVEMRDISYIISEATPTQEDYSDTAKEIAAMAEEFEVTEDPALFVNLNSDTKYDASYRRRDELAEGLRDFAFGEDQDAIYGPALEGDIYTIAKVISKKQLPDSIGAKHILISSGQETLADSIITVLKKDKSKFAELSAEFSYDQAANQTGGDLGTFDYNQMIPEFSAAVADAKVGSIIKVETSYGIHVVEVTKIGERHPKVQLAIVDIQVAPSNKTNQMAYAVASNFASAINKGDNFDAVAAEQGVSKRLAKIAAGERIISNIEGTTAIVRWAYGAKEVGEVSDVVSVGEQNFVAQVTGITENGYRSLSDVALEIKILLKDKKKVEYLASKLGEYSSLEQASEALDIEVKSAEDINFKTYYVPGLGVALNAIGELTNLSEGALSQPIISSNNVSLIKVTNIAETNNTNTQKEKVVISTANENSLQQRIMAAVYSQADVKDKRILFF